MSKFSESQFEVLPTSTGDSWRVRITDQDRTQYINGFDSREQADNWITNQGEAWLRSLERFAIHR
jgi:hypothetical protein